MSHRSDTLYASYHKNRRDIIYTYPTKVDGALMHWLFNQKLQEMNFLEELEARGYDITTLRFCIRKKQTKDDLKKEKGVKYIENTPEQIERAKKIMEDHKKEFEYLAKK